MRVVHLFVYSYVLTIVACIVAHQGGGPHRFLECICALLGFAEHFSSFEDIPEEEHEEALTALSSDMYLAKPSAMTVTRLDFVDTKKCVEQKDHALWKFKRTLEAGGLLVPDKPLGALKRKQRSEIRGNSEMLEK